MSILFVKIQHPSIITLAIVPIIIVGWLWGIRPAIFTTLFFFVISIIIINIYLAETPTHQEYIGGWMTFITFILVGIVVGKLGALSNKLRQELALRQQLEHTLRANENYLKTIFNFVSTGMMVVDVETHVILDVNPAMAKAFGAGKDKIVGASCHQFLCPAQKGKCPITDLGQTVDNSERIMIKANGEKISVFKSVIPIIVNDRKALLESFIDISSMVETKKQVELSEKRYHTLFDFAAEGILVARIRTMKFIFANPAICHMLGYSQEELTQLDVGAIHPKEALPQVVAEFEAQAQGEKILAEDLPCLRKDGTIVYVDIKTTQMIIDNEACNVGFFTDITERKKDRKKMTILLEELKRSNTELEQFAYVASHDLQEPLRMVSSYLQLLEKRYMQKLDSDAHEFIGFAVDGAKRMKGLIDDLLAYSRVSTKSTSFVPVECNSIYEKAVKNLKITIEEHNARITHDELPRVMADEGQLVQLFQNLIGNAIKFCKNRIPEVHISAKQEEDKWLLGIQDNGIGIAPEHCERIFQIFQRLHSREEYEGTGIGLAVCNKIVVRHGGKIWVESEKSKGTTFWFTMPKS